MRGSPSSLLFLNISQGSLRATSWISSNKLPQPKQYATESSQSNTNRKHHGLTLSYLGYHHGYPRESYNRSPNPTLPKVRTAARNDGFTTPHLGYGEMLHRTKSKSVFCSLLTTD